MSSSYSFRPQTNTYHVAVTAAASTPVQIVPPSGNIASYSQYLVTNPGTTGIWFNLTVASTSAPAIPAGGANATLNFILPESAATFTGPPNAYCSSIGTANGDLYVQGGEGL